MPPTDVPTLAFSIGLFMAEEADKLGSNTSDFIYYVSAERIYSSCTILCILMRYTVYSIF